MSTSTKSQNLNNKPNPIIVGFDSEFNRVSDLGFCGVGKHSYKKAAILDCYAGRSNLSCAYASEGAGLMSKTALGIGIFRDFRMETSSGVGSLR